MHLNEGFLRGSTSAVYDSTILVPLKRLSQCIHFNDVVLTHVRKVLYELFDYGEKLMFSQNYFENIQHMR